MELLSKPHPCLVEHEKAINLIVAGNATITIKNKRNLKHFTYRIFAPKGVNPDDAEFLIVKVLTGSDNTSNYTVIGHIILEDDFFKYIHKSYRINPQAPSVRQISMALLEIQSGDDEESNIEIWHEGKCCRCGRLLTHSESVELGIGPECLKIISAHQGIMED